MKTRLSLVTAIAVTALGVVVPAAVADSAPKLADAVRYFRANELATAAASATSAPSVDTFQRPVNELGTAATTSGATSAPSVDTLERPVPTSGQASTSATGDSGSSIAWGQISLAFGVGLVLALGLMAVVRFRPRRPVVQ
jgi:hypothetical protein